LLTIFSVLMLVGVTVFAGDPTGELTEGAGTGTDATLAKVALAVDSMWTLVAAFLVAFMVLGFALLETGFCRAKNAANICMKNLWGAAGGTLAYWVLGFALMFGGAIAGHEVIAREVGPSGWGLFGWSGFFLSAGGANDVQVHTLFLFQAVFCLTAVTIVSGAMAERTKFIGFVLFALVAGGLIYPVFGNWAWGGGFLGTDGIASVLGANYADFAGSGVVHMIGGTMALAGARLVGPRTGKFRDDGTPVAIPGHSIPIATLGTIILWFGWFGFNAGSTLQATNLRISVIAVNTFLAACAGTFGATLYTWRKYGKSDPTMMLNGSLAGLVAVTAPCAYVGSWAAVLIGLVAGFLVVISASIVERRFHIDDPVGAISVHGTCGAWGLLSLGLLADGKFGGVTGLFYGSFGQLVAQVIGIIVILIWAYVAASLTFWILSKTVGLRATVEEEGEGLDLSEHNLHAYPEWEVPAPD
jgi:Amt family ammonium transporter